MGAKALVPTTMTVTPTMVTYESTVTASGVVSSQQAGERVTIQARACGEGAFKVAKRVVSRAGGRWSVVLRPRLNTRYRAQARNATSSVVAVAVGPRLRLHRPLSPRQEYQVTVWAAQAFADTFASTVVTLQRFDAATRQWVLAKRAVLKTVRSELTDVGRTFVSSVTIFPRIREGGQRVRVVLPHRQAAPCYIAGVSNVVYS